MSPLLMFVLCATLSAIICGIFMLIARERLQARLTAAERDRACLTLAENVGSVATWIVDKRTGTLFWSDRVYAIHGRDKAKGTPELEAAIDYYHPDDRERVRKTVEEAISSGSPFHLDARLIDEQGVEKSVISRGICTVGQDGEVVELFGVFFETTPTRSFAVLGNEDLNTLSLEEDYHADA